MEFPKHNFQQLLFAWWRERGRILPWREKSGIRDQPTEISQDMSVRENTFATYFAGELQRDPYRVIVSEVMLQQTQVERVKQKYEAWMRKWPTINDLAKATLPEVLIEWQGLGYNRRARFLWLLAKEIVEQRSGEWPKTEKDLLRLPGIGRYTARAVMAFALGAQVGVVDVNVKRVLRRWVKFDNELTERAWFECADQVLPVNQADPWNQALMDFGALVCTAKNPKCEKCPMHEICAANVHAKAKGFGNYREFLLSDREQLASHSQRTKKGKDTGLKFEETDRFFRGRIIDLLRSKELPKEELFTILNTQYNLGEKERFEALITGLQKEQMIEHTNDVIRLAQ